MQQLDGVTFDVRKGFAYWENGDGAVYAFISISCPNGGCSGKVSFTKLYTGTFRHGFDAVVGNPLDDYANGFEKSGKHLRPIGECPECGGVFRITRHTANRALELAREWASHNTPNLTSA